MGVQTGYGGHMNSCLLTRASLVFDSLSLFSLAKRIQLVNARSLCADNIFINTIVDRIYRL